MDIPKNYDPKVIENKWFDFWMSNDYFHSIVDYEKTPYTTVLPPPNSCNSLHIGHAINATFQDILIRYKRLQGFNTLWIPGTDHGGISTEFMFRKYLLSTGQTEPMDRDQFRTAIMSWILGKREIIVNQLKKLGLSLDWSKEQFTLSDKLSKNVNTVFKNLYEKDMIYRGSYIVNQCVSCQTALSNDEVEHVESKGSLYYITYKLSDQDQSIVIATTRPETMLGDVAVACNPDDTRYSHLVGEYVIVPIVNRK